MDYQSFQPGGQEQSVPPYPIPEIPKIQNLSERLRPYRWYIAIVGGIIITLLFGAYSYSKNLAQQNDDVLAKQAEDAQKQADEIIQKRTQDVTTDWKTYANTQYGFEIRYPYMWKVQFEKGTSNNPQFYLAFSVPDSSSPTGYASVGQMTGDGNFISKGSLDMNVINLKQSTNINGWSELDVPGGKAFYVYSGDDFAGASGPYSAATLVSTNAKYDLSLSGKDQNLFNQILSTFKFTK